MTNKIIHKCCKCGESTELIGDGNRICQTKGCISYGAIYTPSAIRAYEYAFIEGQLNEMERYNEKYDLWDEEDNGQEYYRLKEENYRKITKQEAK